MSQTKPSLSLFEKLDFFLAVLETATVAALTVFTAPFRGSGGHKVFWKHVVHRALRTMNSRASARQFQSISLSTEEAYNQFTKSKGFQPVTTPLKSGAKAHWIGSGNAKNVLVFFHGGGFVHPATTQYDFLWEVQQSGGEDCAAVLLGFSLAPGKQYPVQLQQAVGLLRYLIEEAGRKPENLIFAGDSGGANLALGVVSHLLHPHPSIEPLSTDGPLKGMLLVSPWVSFATSSPSYVLNSKRDATDARVLQKWSEYYLGDGKPDEYNQPLLAIGSWWDDLASKVAELCITAGSDETPISDVEKFVQTLKKTPMRKLDVIIGAGETHDQPFVDPLTGEKTESETRLAAKAWLSSKL